MRVRAYPADLSGCSYYRILEPVEAAKRAGVDASWSYVFPNRLKRRDDGVERVVGLHEDLDADVVVFHRPLNYLIADSIRFLRKAGIGVVVDLDDDYYGVARDTGFGQLSRSDPRENLEHLRRACKLADVVTCSVPLIAQRWGAGHGVVVRNGIPPHVLEIPHVGGGGIGWSGELTSHAGDLLVCGDGVKRALEATGLPFTHVGHPKDRFQVQRDLQLAQTPPSTGWTEPGKHFENIAKLDIGIAPLADTPLARARSGIKVLEYAALGIPSVVSPQSEYELLASEWALCSIVGPGWPFDWFELLYTAAERVKWRQAEDAESLRDRVREHHTTDVTVIAAIDAWETAAQKAQRRGRNRSRAR